MSRRHLGLGLGIAVFVGATLAAPPAATAATTTTDVVRDGISINVTHVDGATPTTDKHPLSRYDIDADGHDDIIINGFAGSKYGTYTTSVRLSRTGAVERLITGSTDLSRGVVADFDGDGFGDFAVTDDRGPNNTPQYAGGIWVFYGSLGGFALDRTAHFSQATAGIPGDPTAFARFGWGLTAADFDGDGRSELVANQNGPDRWFAIMRGAAGGLTATGTRQITPAQLSPVPVAGYGFTPLVAGDVTGDGHPDLAIATGLGWIYLLRGSATGPLLASPSIVDTGAVSNLLVNLYTPDSAVIADVNGDGFGDLIVGADGAVVSGNSSAGAVVAFYGNAQGISAQRRTLLHERSIGVPDDPASGDRFGDYLSAGDVTGDGIDDVVVGADETVGGVYGFGALYVFRGSPQGLHPADNQRFTQDSPGVPGTYAGDHYFGQNRVLDLNGTGPLDVLAVATFEDVVARFLGGPGGLTADDAYDTSELMSGGAAWPMLPAAGAAGSSSGGAALASSPSQTSGIAVGGTATAVGSALAFQQTMAARAVPPRATGTLPESAPGPAEAGAGLSPVSTAARYDLDGDGKDEAVVASNESVVVRLSRTNQVDHLYSPGGQTWAIGRASAGGDFDHDGYADLVVGAFSEAVDGLSYAGTFWVCRGSADGPLYDDCLHISQSTLGVAGDAQANSYFGSVVATGDLNGDGYADLAVGAPGESRPNPKYRRTPGANRTLPQTGSVTIFYGGAGGLKPANAQRLIQPQPIGLAYYNFGGSLAIGDVTGDGRADLAVGIPGMGKGTVELYAGTASGIGAVPTSRVMGNSLQGNGQMNFATALSIADTNADGRGDVLVGAPLTSYGTSSTGAIVEFRGQPSGISAAAMKVIRPGAGGVPKASQPMDFGRVIATGDVNGDGYADLVAGVPYANPTSDPYPQSGLVILMLGSATGIIGTGSVLISESLAPVYLGSSVSILSTDGTGGMEVIAGAPGGDPMQSSQIGTYYEYRYGNGTLTKYATTTAANVARAGQSIYGLGAAVLHN